MNAQPTFQIIDANNKPTPYCNPLNITTQATTLVKTGQGFLHILDFTAVANGVITIYDGIDATGTKLRTITTPGTVLQNEVNKIMDLSFAVGLCIVTSGASQNILVNYL